jgi:hypothetical protein
MPQARGALAQIDCRLNAQAVAIGRFKQAGPEKYCYELGQFTPASRWSTTTYPRQIPGKFVT